MKTLHHQFELTPELEERMDFHRKWSKDFGEESMLELACGTIQHLSNCCKEYRQKINELETSQSWVTNPDRMGGFTDAEVAESNTWR